ncbi:NUDIX domain-containing protein [Acinetobacter pragensis]|uniref:NUDIX domain-containing protein n=1 Tax=Acinetobacter pragensis TaxID=1806892 RepID=UPI00334250BE
MSKPNLHIAIGILLHHGKVLVGWREASQHQGNKHEFPGGKVEEGETPVEACRREIYEEVGIGLHDWQAFDFIRHEYDDVIVNLHLFQAAVPDELLNEIQPPWAWYSRDQLLDLNFPKANKAMLKRLYWQRYIKISDDLSALPQISEQQLMYWRTEAAPEKIKDLAECNINLLDKLIVNIELWKQLNSIQQQGIGAVHLKQAQCMQLKKGDLKIGCRYLAACHDLISALHAQSIGCDAILLSPVLPTETHPDAPALGWEQFEMIAAQLDIPVFALGGMKQDNLIDAQQHKGYGIAGVRFF